MSYGMASVISFKIRRLRVTRVSGPWDHVAKTAETGH